MTGRRADNRYYRPTPPPTSPTVGEEQWRIDMRFWIDVEDASGVRQGAGPVTAALYWRSVRRLDRAGEFSFEMPATDSWASLVTARRVARCKAIIAGAVVEVGAGIVDSIATRIGEDGAPMLVVSGPDLLGELRRVVLDERGTGAWAGWPDFNEENDVPYQLIHGWANAKLASAWALADEGGSTIGAGTPVTNTDIYATFRHESVLAGLIAVAQATEEHFRLGTGRVVEWINTWNASGLRAVYGAVSPVAVEGRTEIAPIAAIERVQDSQDIVNRMFLFGAGDGAGQLDVMGADEWPDGVAIGGGVGPFSRTIDGVLYYLAKDTTSSALDFSFFCLQNNASDTTYGPNEMRLAFGNIAPISNTAADVTAAANQLIRSGWRWLKTRSNPQDFYRLSLAGAQAILKPGTTIPVYAQRWVDGAQAVDIDATLNILETTVEVGVDGLRTTELLVSTTERQPESDVGVVVERMAEATVRQAHQQISANSYTENHVAAMDDSNQADFYFWLGEDIAQVQQILLRFRVDPLRSTVRSVAGNSTGSGAASTSNSGGTASTTSSVGSQSVSHTHTETGTTTLTESGAHIHAVTMNSHIHTIDHTHTFTPGVATTYGLHVEASGNTYGHSGGAATTAQIQADIDILVGGSDRSASIVAESASGWFRLDVTAWLIDATTLRPSAAANVISFIKAAAAAAGKSAQITFKLQVRATVQSVNYS